MSTPSADTHQRCIQRLWTQRTSPSLSTIAEELDLSRAYVASVVHKPKTTETGETGDTQNDSDGYYCSGCGDVFARKTTLKKHRAYGYCTTEASQRADADDTTAPQPTDASSESTKSETAITTDSPSERPEIETVEDVKQQYVDGEIGDLQLDKKLEAAIEQTWADKDEASLDSGFDNDAEAILDTDFAT